MGKAFVTYSSRKRSYANSFEAGASYSTMTSSEPVPMSPEALQLVRGNSDPASDSQQGKESYAFTSNDSALLPLLRVAAPRIAPSKSINQPYNKRPKLTQLTIDLGGNPQKRCKECGMEYVPSNAEDTKIHKEFHASSVGGVNVPMTLGDKWRAITKCEQRMPKARALFSGTRKRNSSGHENMDLIISVSSHDKPVVRRWAKRVLEEVEKELGALETTADRLWSFDETVQGRINKFKAYLYIHGKKCVGFCLAQRITATRQIAHAAYTVDHAKESEVAPPAVGISRIWVAKEYRRLGIATELLETAMDNASNDSDKATLAFSQPTEMGGYLAKAWFGTGQPLRTYDDP